MSEPRDFDVTPVDAGGAPADAGDEEEIRGPARPLPGPLRRPALRWLAAGAAALAVCGMLLANRHHPHPSAAPGPSPSATLFVTPDVGQPAQMTVVGLDGPEEVYVYAPGGFCPVGVDCVVSGEPFPCELLISARSAFPAGHPGSTGSWFDARTGLVYSQQLTVLLADHGSDVSLFERRLAPAGQDAHGAHVVTDPDWIGGPATVTITVDRDGWRLTADLMPGPHGGALPVQATERWLTTLPLPN